MLPKKSKRYPVQGMVETSKEVISWNPKKWNYLHELTPDWGIQYCLEKPPITHVTEAYNMNPNFLFRHTKLPWGIICRK